jgi:hypothetical protein
LVEETGGPGENLLDEMLNIGIKMWDIYIYIMIIQETPFKM